MRSRRDLELVIVTQGRYGHAYTLGLLGSTLQYDLLFLDYVTFLVDKGVRCISLCHFDANCIGGHVFKHILMGASILKG